MKKVFKYILTWDDYFDLELPEGAQILHFDDQNGEACLWCLVDPDNPIELRRFRLAGTGHEIEDNNIEHIGTAKFRGGMLVFHLFEVL